MLAHVDDVRHWVTLVVDETIVRILDDKIDNDTLANIDHFCTHKGSNISDEMTSRGGKIL